jgi:hypothetical protein
MSVVVNLKSALTFRIDLAGKAVAWSSKTFRAIRQPQTIPEPKEHVAFDVTEIALDSRDVPWYSLNPPIRISVLWSNVLSVQHEEVVI